MSTIDSAPQPSVAPAATDALASGQANGATPAAAPTQAEGFDRWIKDFQKYESMLTDIAKTNSDPKFKEEFATIQKWFVTLTITEKTAALYSLVQDADQEQAKFLSAILQQKIPAEEPSKPAPSPAVASPAAKFKGAGKAARPPTLNIPDPASPTTPTALTARESAVDEQSHNALLSQAERKGNEAAAGLGNTPVLPLFQKDKDAADAAAKAASTTPLPGFSGMNPYTLNMLANAGLSSEAQLLAAQLVMSGLVQPTALLQSQAKPKKTVPGSAAWRTPVSARYPASALRSSGLRPSSSLKSAGLKSSALVPPVTPFSAMETPKEEDFDPEMLKDIPAWLRSLRLHKYTQCFDGLTWQELVSLDDAALEAKGVAALGARRRLLRTFEHVKKRMGLATDEVDDDDRSDIPGESGSAATTPTTAAIPAPTFPRSKLSINSPIFMPSSKNGADASAPAAEA